LVRQALVDAAKSVRCWCAFPRWNKSRHHAVQALKDLQIEVKIAPSNVMAESGRWIALRRKVLTTKTKLIGNAFALLALVAVFASIDWAHWCITAFPDHPPAGGVSEVSKYWA